MTRVSEVAEQTRGAMYAEPKVIYRPVPGMVDVYAGTDASIVHPKKGLLKPVLLNKNEPEGYLRVNVPGYPGVQRIHWLVAAAFLGEKPKSDLPRGIHVCHSNSDKQCNIPSNLYYGTPKQNVHDAIANGKHGAVTHASKTECAQGHEFTPDNTYEVPNSPGWRQCKICRHDIQLERNRRNLNGRPSNDEKRAMVDAALRSDPKRSGYSIAKELNVSAPMVERRRKMMKGNPLWP